MMELLHVANGIYRSDDLSTGFRSMAEALARIFPLRCAISIGAEDRSIRHAWPDDATLSDDLRDTVLHALRPEVFPLGSEFPFDSARYPDSEMLLLPVRKGDPRSAVHVLVAQQGAFGEDLQPWQELLEAIEQFEQRCHRIAAAEARCAELQRRVEESEALHSLGLTANRTLDREEVLNLVARFTRTLLGAHYTTVCTSESGKILTVASVGLRNATAASSDYHLARTVIEAAKPLVVGDTEDDLSVNDFPFHAAEEMKVGLGIPLSLFGDTFGALIVGYRTPYDVTPHDTRLALTLAGHAAVAISNARLHERVEQRSRELEKAYQELDRLSQAKERFFASINHELRNPLGAILGYQTLILDGASGELPPPVRQYLQKANRATRTLQLLVNDLLDLSKIAAGKMELELRPCSLQEIVEGALNTIQPLAEEKGVSLTVPPIENLPPVHTEPNRVQQILVNLLSNAVKFTGKGGISLHTRLPPPDSSAEADREAGGWVDLCVTDTGPGISSEDLDRVFEEFEQVKGTRGGTGLGLPISRRLARLLGGELWAESEVGVGSTFVLRLPYTAVMANPDQQTVPR